MGEAPQRSERGRSPASTKEVRELLLRLYEEDRAFARHHEAQRTQASSLVIAVSAGLLAFISRDDKLGYLDLPSAFLIIVLGVFGVIFTQKHYERIRLHLYRAYEYFHKIDELTVGANAAELVNAANAKSRQRFGKLTDLHLHTLWITLHALIALTGVTIAAIAILRGYTGHPDQPPRPPDQGAHLVWVARLGQLGLQGEAR